MYQTLIFDLDGTIIDSIDLHTEIFRRNFASSHYNVSTTKLQSMLGLDLNSIYKACLPAHLHEFAKIHLKDLYSEFDASLINLIKPLPNAISTLNDLSLKYNCLLVSNAHETFVSQVVKHLSLDMFQMISGASENLPNKIDRCLAITEDAAAYGKCLYIGDTYSDINLAQRLSIDSCLLNSEYAWCHKQTQYSSSSIATHTVNEWTELLRIL